VFEVRVRGLVPDELVPRLDAVEVVSHELRTSFLGHFADQAELHGFLARLRAFGLEVVEVRRRVEPPARVAPAAPDDKGGGGGVGARPNRAGVVYEVTVEGALGPVLRRALRLECSEGTVASTTLRAAAGDLPGLVALLESHGQVIEGVWLLSAPR
jgi:hypothetical protein